LCGPISPCGEGITQSLSLEEFLEYPLVRAFMFLPGSDIISETDLFSGPTFLKCRRYPDYISLNRKNGSKINLLLSV